MADVGLNSEVIKRTFQIIVQVLLFFPDVFVHQAAQILSTLPHTAWQPSPTRPAGSWRTWSRSTRLVHTRLSSPQVLSMRIRTGRKTFHCFMFISKISRWSSTIKMSSIQLRLVVSFEIKIYLKWYFKDLIAAFGGLIGLCTGFSLLSLAEIIYFFTLRWWLQLCQEKRFCLHIHEKLSYFMIHFLQGIQTEEWRGWTL